VDQDDSPLFRNSRETSKFQGADERIPIALSHPQVTADGPTIQPISTDLTPPTAILKATELETESGSYLVADTEAGPMREREGAPTDEGDFHKSRPDSRGGERADKGLERHDQSGNGGEPDVDARSRLDDEDNDSDGDPNDEEYADDSDATGSDSEGRPRPPKRRRWEKSTEDGAIIGPSASDVVSHTNATDGSSQGTGTTPSVVTQEREGIPIRGFLTLRPFQSEFVYCVTFSQDLSPLCGSERNITDHRSRAEGRRNNRPSPPRKIAFGRGGRNSPFSSTEDALLVKLKEKRGLSWAEITEHFPRRTKGTLQVRYCTKLKRRPEGPQPGTKRRRSG